MSKFRIAILQLAPENTLLGNLEKGITACKLAKEKNADLALFPELWQIGYDRNKMIVDNAIGLDSPFITQFQKLAQQLEMAIVPTFLGMGTERPTNNLIVINYHGEILMNYAKVHICDFPGGTETKLERGNKFYTICLPFKNGQVKLGSMICMDREFPESARTLMLQGAEIVVVPNSCELHDCPEFGNARIAGMQAAAYENMQGIAVANYANPKHDGHSFAFDATGKPLCEADIEEEIVIADFNLVKIRSHRVKETKVRGKSARQQQAYEI